MDANDRQRITSNIASLVEHTNIDILIPKLLEKGVFSTLMIEKYLDNGSLSPQQRKTDLYLDIQRRGPEAFAKLLDSLNETGHYNLVSMLRPNYIAQRSTSNGEPNNIGSSAQVGNGSQSHGPVSTLHSLYYSQSFQNRIKDVFRVHPHAVLNFTTRPLRVVVKQATIRLDGVHSKGNLLRIYPMGSRPKGHFFMINNIKFVNDIAEERKGAEVDEENLTLLFKGLGYEVIKHRNLGLEDMKRSIAEFSQLDVHKNVDSFVMAILSHGHSGEEAGSTDIVAADGGHLSSNWILSRFNNYHCPNLIDRPKIFIFQACRGIMEDFGVRTVRPRNRIQVDGQPVITLRSYSDMLMAYSTIPGYVSRRDVYTGTWYIDKICKVFMEHACDTDIKDLLTMVDNELKKLITDSETMQTSSFESWGFQKFYFNPGLYNYDEEPTSNGPMEEDSPL